MVEKRRDSNATLGAEHLGDISRATDQREEAAYPLTKRKSSRGLSKE
jgi:hypothetical protein